MPQLFLRVMERLLGAPKLEDELRELSEFIARLPQWCERGWVAGLQTRGQAPQWPAHPAYERDRQRQKQQDREEQEVNKQAPARLVEFADERGVVAHHDSGHGQSVPSWNDSRERDETG